MYIERRLPPALVSRVMNMNIPGVEVRREYKRFYPGGPVSAHLIGFTDVDDIGQEGLELAFNNHLKGREGRKRVLKDLAGHYVESVDSITQVEHGKDLVVSVDQRIQSMASAYLEEAAKYLFHELATNDKFSISQTVRPERLGGIDQRNFQ